VLLKQRLLLMRRPYAILFFGTTDFAIMPAFMTRRLFMNSRFRLAIFAIVCLFAMKAAAVDAPANLPATDWLQWRGPTATGEAAPDAKPPLSWSEDTNIRWKIAIPGRGRSTPIIWKDRIFITTAVQTDTPVDPEKVKAAMDATPEFARKGAHVPEKVLQFVVMALKRSDGSVLWRKTVCEQAPLAGTHADGSWASGSPITDGESLYAYFGSYGLYAMTLDGEKKWSKDLGTFKTKANFGEGVSPVLCGDLLIINQDFEGPSFIVALDRKTGEEKWRVKRDEATSWSTPLIIQHGGKQQIVVSATNRIRSYNPEDGAILWEIGGMTGNVVPCPITDGNLVFCMSGFRGNALFAIKLAAAGGELAGKPEAMAWSSKTNTSYVPSPVLSGGLLYYIKANEGFLTCADATTGQVNYAAKLDGLQTVFASPIAAGGHLYVPGKNGLTLVLKLGPKFELIASNQLNDEIISSPAVVGNELFLRGDKNLYCITGK
jgi:outer membrane protein assembly factor BamB